MLRCLTAGAVSVALFCSQTSAQTWPDFSKPAPAVGGGVHDAVVIVAAENYIFAPPVLGAKENASAWYDYFEKTRGVPVSNIALLRDNQATAENIKKAVEHASALAGQEGTLWFIFIGHGAADEVRHDGLLIGTDVLLQPTEGNLKEHSLPIRSLVQSVLDTKAGHIAVLIDACFSGKGIDNAPLLKGLQPLPTVDATLPTDPRLVILTGARGDELAGPLPGGDRPAFSYLALGALRGWAVADSTNDITAGSMHEYVRSALRATLRHRTQTPVIVGRQDVVLSRSPREKGPDIGEMAKIAYYSQEDSNFAEPPEKTLPQFRSGMMNVDANFPGVGIRAFISDKTAVEGRAQFAIDVQSYGMRYYWYPALFTSVNLVRPYLLMEGAYGRFKGASTLGAGLAGGGGGGIEYALSRSFSVQIDAEGEYFSIKDNYTALTAGELEFILNLGVNYYFR